MKCNIEKDMMIVILAFISGLLWSAYVILDWYGKNKKADREKIEESPYYPYMFWLYMGKRQEVTEPKPPVKVHAEEVRKPRELSRVSMAMREAYERELGRDFAQAIGMMHRLDAIKK